MQWYNSACRGVVVWWGCKIETFFIFFVIYKMFFQLLAIITLVGLEVSTSFKHISPFAKFSRVFQLNYNPSMPLSVPPSVPQNISIEIVNKLFDELLQAEQAMFLEENNMIFEEQINVSLQKKINKDVQKLKDDIMKKDQCENQSNIEINMKRLSLLNTLKAPTIHDNVKLQHIEANRHLLSNTTTNNTLNNGGLWNDWNIEIE